MELWPNAKYVQQGKSRGTNDLILKAALDRAHRSQVKGFPAILTLNHLAEHCCVTYGDLRAIISRRIDPYRSFLVRKKPRGYRVICVPDPALMRLQRWIHQHILRKVTPHPASKAYSPKSSPLACAQMHSGCKWLIKIDIRQFFESIDERKVYRVFRDCGYQALVAFELARLTTRVPSSGHLPQRQRWKSPNNNGYKIKAYRADNFGHLPQGAPTSPMLANLVMFRFDEIVTSIAGEYYLTYTRYSDDLTFSSQDRDFTRKKAREFIARVYGLMRSYDLEPKTTKTNVVALGARKVVLGLTVNDDCPRLTREWKRMLECHVHYVRRFGYVVHAKERKFSSALGCFHHIQGLIAYAMHVEPDFATRLKLQLVDVPPPF